ncbi:MAG: alpha/beta hydrolase [Sarcina sp.]
MKVNGHNMHIYSEGTGEIPIVFMSGGGTSSPVLDFKSLYSLLSKKYKIVVIEKIGYGFSDIADVPRDIDSILSDTREALRLSGINGPFILAPHSMSRIEALYWAQKYPGEVKGIIGLDMAFPNMYEEYKINMPLLKLSQIGANIGITRLIASISKSDAIKYGTLTNAEKELYKAIFYKRTATSTMLSEVENIKENAKKVSDKPLPSVPILLFSSNGKGTGYTKDEWKRLQEEALRGIRDEAIIYLDCSHYVHDIEYEKIAETSNLFIESIYKGN